MTAVEWKNVWQNKEIRKTYEAPEARLGVFYQKEKTEFRVWAPGADHVNVCFYAAGSLEETTKEKNYDNVVAVYGQKLALVKENQNVFEGVAELDCEGIYYTYEIIRGVHVEETQDPYSVACGVNGKRSQVVDLKSTNPILWDQDAYFKKSVENAVIYELHVKDFSNDIHSGIKQEYRGKYLAFTQTKTTYDQQGKFTTGIDYLKELGVTHVHLLPTYEFASIDESKNDNQFNWGYDPLLYNVPEGSYATNPYDGRVRIKEFKQMVQALHNAGIGVVLDMVFNHTYSTDSVFQKTAPYYFYRQTEDGSFSDASACGNETASERCMMRKFMVESVLYWQREYHVDGFRFDLMGVHDTETMNAIRDALDQTNRGKYTLLYGEPWYAKTPALESSLTPAVKANVTKLRDNIAIFHDDTRDAIKGSVFEARDGGFVNGKGNMEMAIKHSILGWCDTENGPKVPSQVISYVSAHDNYTLWDKMAFTYMQEPEFEHGTPEMEKACRLAAAIVQFSLGTPFFQAGEEFFRTKEGDENSFCSSAEVNQLNWERRVQYNDTVKYYKGLIHLRKMSPVFACNEKETIKDFRFDRVEKGVVAFEITKTGNYKWPSYYVIFNANKENVRCQLPNGLWQLLVNEKSSMCAEETLEYMESYMEVAACSATVLGRYKTSKEKNYGFHNVEHKWKENRSFSNINSYGGIIMDFFSKVGEKITSASKVVADSAKDQTEIISLKSQISSCDNLVRHQYEEIGRLVFEATEQDVESPYAEKFAEIRKTLNEKELYQQKIDLIKSQKSHS